MHSHLSKISRVPIKETHSFLIILRNTCRYLDEVIWPRRLINSTKVLAGRLIPRTLFDLPNIDRLVNAFLRGMQTSQNPLEFVKPIETQICATGPANHDDNSATGFNPAWRRSIWELFYAGRWVQGIPQVVQDGVAKVVHTTINSFSKEYHT